VALIRVDTSTKERLTGALLVVLALVVVVPELLSGHRPTRSGEMPAQNPEEGAPLQTYHVQLDAPDAGAVAAHDVPPAAAAQIAAVPPPVTQDAPPESTAAPPAPPAPPAAPDAAIPAGKPGAVKPVAAAPAAAATGNWWVQLGSFASRDNAQHLAQKMRGAGFKIEVSQSRVKGKDLFMVRAGPVADRSAAAALQARLAAAGQKKSLLVAP
jgi:DedD protein